MNLIEGVKFLFCDGDLRINALEFHLQVLEVNLVAIPLFLCGRHFGVEAVDAIFGFIDACLE